jgi:hypothetical protein
MSFNTCHIIPLKQLWWQFNRWLSGLHCWSGRYGVKKGLLPLPGIEPYFLGYLALSLLSIPTELAWVLQKKIPVQMFF